MKHNFKINVSKESKAAGVLACLLCHRNSRKEDVKMSLIKLMLNVIDDVCNVAESLQNLAGSLRALMKAMGLGKPPKPPAAKPNYRDFRSAIANNVFSVLPFEWLAWHRVWMDVWKIWHSICNVRTHGIGIALLIAAVAICGIAVWMNKKGIKTYDLT